MITNILDLSCVTISSSSLIQSGDVGSMYIVYRSHSCLCRSVICISESSGVSSRLLNSSNDIEHRSHNTIQYDTLCSEKSGIFCFQTELHTKARFSYSFQWPLLCNLSTSLSDCEIHCGAKKTAPFYFCHKFVKTRYILMIFGIHIPY